MSQIFGLVIESLVATLLVLTICYCIMLNKRLKLLRADEQSLKATIGELITATEIAERAIGGLKLTVRDCNENLGGQLSLAADMCGRLSSHINNGEQVFSKLSRIALAAKTLPEGRTSGGQNTKAIAAAAQAFADRQRADGLAA
jgi:hypothetical protein